MSSPSISDDLLNPNELYNLCAFVLVFSAANFIDLFWFAVFKILMFGGYHSHFYLQIFSLPKKSSKKYD